MDLATLLQSIGVAPSISQAPPPPSNWQEMLGGPVPAATPGYGGEEPPVSQDIEGTEEIGSKGLEKFQHKGLFGVKGTLRDILGIFGDTFGEGGPRYSQQRRKERYGDILAGMYQNNEEENLQNNPDLVLQRLAQHGFGEQAQELYGLLAKQKQAEAQLARQNARDDQLAKQGDFKAQKDARDVVASLFSGLSTEQQLATFLPRAEAYLKKAGLVDEQGNLVVPLPTNLGEARNWGIDPYRYNRLGDFDQDREQRGDIAGQRIGAQIRGQDVSAATQRRGQDISAETQRRGQDLRGPGRYSEKRGNSPLASMPSLFNVPPPPRKRGDKMQGPDGTKYVSPDGKNWKKQP